jgi:hypothetical protein
MLGPATSNTSSDQTVTQPAANACTNACTKPGDGGDGNAVGEIDAGFSEALKMIATLP